MMRVYVGYPEPGIEIELRDIELDAIEPSDDDILNMERLYGWPDSYIREYMTIERDPYDRIFLWIGVDVDGHPVEIEQNKDQGER